MSGPSDSQIEQFKATFFEECAELQVDLEQRLSVLESGSHSIEDLHAIFRAIHSIKAGAGTFGFTKLVTFTHSFETMLDHLRDGALEITPDVVDILFKSSDIVAEMVDLAQQGGEPEAGFGDEVLAQIDQILAAMSNADGADGDAQTEDSAAELEREGSVAAFKISFKPHPSLLRNANEPLLIIRELKTLGELKTEIDSARVPGLHALEPEDLHFSWLFTLRGACRKADVEEVFEFVDDDCDLTIERLGADGTEETPRAPAESPSQDTPKASTAAVEPARGPSSPGGDAPAKERRTSSIRVDLEKVDKLVNTVGELVITQAMLAQQLEALEADKRARIASGLEELSTHTRDLQENVMAIRMQPVKSVFSRMPRLVRDLAGKLDKKIKLITRGEETELDKTVIEELADPLTHMIRNSVDHGLECPEERLEAEKPAEGTIVLSAEHRGGRIVIEIEDDGRGVNRERVLEKAIDQGLVPADAKLSPEEIDNLIFAPGFSTAAAVTDVSGRGVGMDVVRRNITNLGGKITVQSMPGQGTKVILTLPLTLAVLDGMVITVGDQKYVVPLGNILESFRPKAEDVQTLVNGGQVVKMRGEFVRLVGLARIFDVPNATHDPSKGLVMMVESDRGSNFGLIVDELLGQQQVVIKSLEANYDPIDGISAATILGNGQVCLILDLDGLEAMDKLAPRDLLELPELEETTANEAGSDDEPSDPAPGESEVQEEPAPLETDVQTPAEEQDQQETHASLEQ